ncbi:MAG: ribosomal protein L7/L12 [Candidatus Obscuribacterales bacterium]|nr:ribosomal protein L7/L12 [Candidatus Obscuribacterales bacterium]
MALGEIIEGLEVEAAMDTTTLFVLVCSGVLVVGIIVTAVVMFKDQTAPILGNPNQRPADRPVAFESAVQESSPVISAQLTRALPPELPLSAEVQRLVAANRKIEAIKQLRSETGLGLAEAKALIDAMPGESVAEVPADIGLARSRAKELVRAGMRIEAIKLWRESTGADLKTAKDEIDRMSAEQ